MDTLMDTTNEDYMQNVVGWVGIPQKEKARSISSQHQFLAWVDNE